MMAREWMELESDPGVFTLLLAEFGVVGVQVEEIYDLAKPIEDQVYGFIFLFRWSDDRKGRRKCGSDEAQDSYEKDADIISELFFAQQIVPNSCATHSLISILLNCQSIDLGDMLTKFKEFTRNMTPEDKGLAIGSKPELARAHNRHARPSYNTEQQAATQSVANSARGVSSGVTSKESDTFHFVCYVPINNKLYELDGLKPYPIDHGTIDNGLQWTEKFKSVIQGRMKEADQQDVRYSLMAVVPDRRKALSDKLEILNKNKMIIKETLERMLETTENNAGAPDSDNKSSKLRSTRSRRDSANQSAIAKSSASAEEAATSNTGQKTNTKSGDVNPLTEMERIKDVSCNLRAQISIQDLPHSAGGDSVCTNVTSTDVTKPLSIETKLPISSRATRSSTRRDTLASNSLASARLTSGNIGSASPSPNQVDAQPGGTVTPSALSLNAPSSAPAMPASGGGEAASTAAPRSGHLFSSSEVLQLMTIVDAQIKQCKNQLSEECEKRRRYQRDHCRRTFNYDNLIRTYITYLDKCDMLDKLIKQNSVTNTSRKRQSSSNNATSSSVSFTKRSARNINKKS